MMYLLLGPPCSGKTTLGDALSKQVGVPHVVASTLLRDVDPGEMAKDTYDSHLVDVIMTRLREADCARGFILDNFPRTAAQATLLEDALKATFDQGVSSVLDLEVPVKVLEARAGKRLVDRSTGLPVNVKNWLLDSPGERRNDDDIQNNLGISADKPSDEDATMRRSDDDPEHFQHRLQRYANNIADLRAFYGPERCNVLIGTLKEREVLGQALLIVMSKQAGPSAPKAWLAAPEHLVVETIAGREIRVNPAGILTVGEVKQYLERHESIPVGEQRLLHGTTVLQDSDAVPQGRLTLVRQREDDVYEQMRNTLHEGETRVQALRAAWVFFFREVRTPANWDEGRDNQPCGCCTVTRRYVGDDPPELRIVRELLSEILSTVTSCRTQLNKIKADILKRHRQQQETHMEREFGHMNPFSKFFNSVFFLTCSGSPASDPDVASLEAFCTRVLLEAESLRNDASTWAMQTATQTQTIRCALHQPPPPEPGSP